jgi:hypothetical protein
MGFRPVTSGASGAGKIQAPSADAAQRADRAHGAPHEASRSHFKGVMAKSQKVLPSASPLVLAHLRECISRHVASCVDQAKGMGLSEAKAQEMGKAVFDKAFEFYRQRVS